MGLGDARYQARKKQNQDGRGPASAKRGGTSKRNTSDMHAAAEHSRATYPYIKSSAESVPVLDIWNLESQNLRHTYCIYCVHPSVVNAPFPSTHRAPILFAV